MNVSEDLQRGAITTDVKGTFKPCRMGVAFGTTYVPRVSPNFPSTKRSRKHRFGYSDIARKGGFGSRSHPREIALGIKPITARSLHKMVSGLGLSGEVAEYFRLLVYQHHHELSPVPVSPERLVAQRASLKARIRDRLDKTKKDREAAVFLKAHFPTIYAAQGTIVLALPWPKSEAAPDSTKG